MVPLLVVRFVKPLPCAGLIKQESGSPGQLPTATYFWAKRPTTGDRSTALTRYTLQIYLLLFWVACPGLLRFSIPYDLHICAAAVGCGFFAADATSAYWPHWRPVLVKSYGHHLWLPLQSSNTTCGDHRSARLATLSTQANRCSTLREPVEQVCIFAGLPVLSICDRFKLPLVR